MKTQQIPASVRWAALSILVGVVFLFAGMTSRTTAGTTDVVIVPLHNDRAQPAHDCPDTGPSWHFVIAPNNGTFRFVSISLLVGGTLYSFDEDELTRNAGQRDNVFVPVPDGYEPTDLTAVGSFAEITPLPVRPMLKFVLSSICAGSSSPTTTSTSSTSTSMPGAPPKTTTTSVAPSTTSTSAPASTTTTLGSTSTTTTSSPSTTTTTSTTTMPATTSTTLPSSTTTTTTSTSVPGGSTTTSTTLPDVTTTTVGQGGPPAPSTSTTSTSTSTTTTTAPTSTTVATSTTTPTSTTSTTVATSTTTTTLVVTTVSRSMATTGTGGGRVMILFGSVFVLIGGLALLAASRPADER